MYSGIRLLTPILGKDGVLVIETLDRRDGATSAHCPLVFPDAYRGHVVPWERNVPRGWSWKAA